MQKEDRVSPRLFFSKPRYEEICNLIYIKGKKICSEDFYTAEIEYFIDNVPLSEEERELAEMRFVSCMTISAIAESPKSIWNTRKSVRAHVRKVSDKIRTNILRMFR